MTRTENLDTGWIQTFSGHRVWPFIPSHVENVFALEDIAHSLSMQCRFTGHVSRFYSVAEHCVIGSRLLPDRLAMPFLWHDAEEAYVGDITRPLKMQLWVGGYDLTIAVCLADRGDKLRDAILYQNHIPIVGGLEAKMVKEVDDQMLVKEAENLLPGGQHASWKMSRANGFKAADIELLCWEPMIAERKFLERYYELREAIEGDSK